MFPAPPITGEEFDAQGLNVVTEVILAEIRAAKIFPVSLPTQPAAECDGPGTELGWASLSDAFVDERIGDRDPFAIPVPIFLFIIDPQEDELDKQPGFLLNFFQYLGAKCIQADMILEHVLPTAPCTPHPALTAVVQRAGWYLQRYFLAAPPIASSSSIAQFWHTLHCISAHRLEVIQQLAGTEKTSEPAPRLCFLAAAEGQILVDSAITTNMEEGASHHKESGQARRVAEIDELSMQLADSLAGSLAEAISRMHGSTEDSGESRTDSGGEKQTPLKHVHSIIFHALCSELAAQVDTSTEAVWFRAGALLGELSLAGADALGIPILWGTEVPAGASAAPEIGCDSSEAEDTNQDPREQNSRAPLDSDIGAVADRDSIQCISGTPVELYDSAAARPRPQSIVLQLPNADKSMQLATGKLQSCLHCEHLNRCVAVVLPGKWGEEFVFLQLQEQFRNTNTEVEWLNQEDESGCCYDLVLHPGGRASVARPVYIEVKATSTPDKQLFEISHREWLLAQQEGEHFHIYRVFNASVAAAQTGRGQHRNRSRRAASGAAAAPSIVRIINPYLQWKKSRVGVYLSF
jgi:hypothetical protein